MDTRQRYLLPVDMMDWLPEGDIVHLIVDAVALSDLGRVLPLQAKVDEALAVQAESLERHRALALEPGLPESWRDV